MMMIVISNLISFAEFWDKSNFMLTLFPLRIKSWSCPFLADEISLDFMSAFLAQIGKYLVPLQLENNLLCLNLPKSNKSGLSYCRYLVDLSTHSTITASSSKPKKLLLSYYLLLLVVVAQVLKLRTSDLLCKGLNPTC